MWINDWIPTLERWKRGYELRVGDIIFNGEGKPQPILELIEGKNTIKRVNISDNSYIDTHMGESICVGRRMTYMENRDVTEFIKIDEYNNISINDAANNPLFYVANPEIPQYVNQFMDVQPYILGCLIGNAQVRHKDNEILRESIDPDGRIPEIYRTAPIRDRQELLFGMMDTNGIFNAGLYVNSFSTNNPLLAIDLHELVCSLGGTCYRNEQSGVGKKFFLYFILPYPPFKDNLTEKEKWHYYTPKKYKKLDSIVELDELDTIIPVVKGDTYLQGRWYITKRYERS